MGGLAEFLGGVAETGGPSFLSFAQLRMQKEKEKQLQESQKLLDEQRASEEKRKEMEFSWLADQQKQREREKEQFLVPWAVQTIAKPDTPYADLTAEDFMGWSWQSLATLKASVQDVQDNMPYLTPAQAWDIADDKEDNARLIWQQVKETITLEDGSKIEVIPQSYKDKYEKFPFFSSMQAKEDYEAIKVGGTKIPDISGIQVPENPESRRGLGKSNISEDRLKWMVRNKVIRAFFEYQLKPDGTFKNGTATLYQQSLGQQTGITWDAFREAIKGHLTPREAVEGETIYRKKGAGGESVSAEPQEMTKSEMVAEFGTPEQAAKLLKESGKYTDKQIGELVKEYKQRLANAPE